MLQTRTYRFLTKEALVRAIRGLNPHVRIVRFSDLTLTITEDEPDTKTIDEIYVAYGAQPAGPWRDKWR